MRSMIMLIATVVGFAFITLAAPTNAEARLGAGLIPEAAGGSSVQPAQYYGGYRGYGGYRQPYYGYYQPYYAPRYYAPRRYHRPRYYGYY